MNNSESPSLESFKDYMIGTLFQPGRTFDALMTDNRRLKFGFYALLINAVLYTFVYIFLTIGGGAPSDAFKPLLAVPADVYYSYNRFWLAPSMFGCWILAAGVSHLLSRLFSGKGSFEDTLSVFGFGITIATLIALLHDFTDSLLGAIGVLNLREYEVALNSPTIWRTILLTLYSIALVMLYFLLTKGIFSSQKIRRLPAMLIGIVAFVAYQGVFMVFNR